MKRPLFTKNAKVGYTIAGLLFLVACALVAAGWRFLGSAAAGAMVCIALATASAHKHLSKRSR
jgi:hypothetical protein